VFKNPTIPPARPPQWLNVAHNPPSLAEIRCKTALLDDGEKAFLTSGDDTRLFASFLDADKGD